MVCLPDLSGRHVPFQSDPLQDVSQRSHDAERPVLYNQGQPHEHATTPIVLIATGKKVRVGTSQRSRVRDESRLGVVNSEAQKRMQLTLPKAVELSEKATTHTHKRADTNTRLFSLSHTQSGPVARVSVHLSAHFEPKAFLLSLRPLFLFSAFAIFESQDQTYQWLCEAPSRPSIDETGFRKVVLHKPATRPLALQRSERSRAKTWQPFISASKQASNPPGIDRRPTQSSEGLTCTSLLLMRVPPSARPFLSTTTTTSTRSVPSIKGSILPHFTTNTTPAISTSRILSASLSTTFARSKSTHHPPTHTPTTTKSPVLPKPSHIASTLPSEEVSVPSPSPSHPKPPPHAGPPRLVRYEALHPHHSPQSPLSLYPSSYAHASYPDPVSYRAHLSNRRAPASLFGLFPSTSVTAASLKASSDPFAYSGTASGSTIQSSIPTPTQATSAETQVGANNTMTANTSAIVDAAKAGEAELHQRKKAASPNGVDAGTKTSAVLGHHHHHGHAHHHGHDHGSAEEADALLAALKGKGDRGSNITLAGLVSNIGLCGAKGVAGVYLNSAALLADAAHSLSDMFADLVTLFCWKMSQKPPSASHPLGYGKYETMGSLGVSLVLVAGAVGIGFHSYGLLLEALQPTLAHAPAALQALGSFTGSIASLHSHDHGAATQGGVLDPNAMWFALLSIVVKEWLYHATLKIAKEENSSVLEANALHHRSDSLSSAVTFLAIGGSWLGFPVLDPLGGLLVAGLIGKQGADLLIGALGELSDRGVEPETLQQFDSAIVEVQKTHPLLLGWKDLRAVKSGVSTFADVTLQLPTDATLKQASEVEKAVREAITGCVRGVKEVRVRLVTVDG